MIITDMYPSTDSYLARRKVMKHYRDIDDGKIKQPQLSAKEEFWASVASLGIGLFVFSPLIILFFCLIVG